MCDIPHATSHEQREQKQQHVKGRMLLGLSHSHLDAVSHEHLEQQQQHTKDYILLD